MWRLLSDLTFTSRSTGFAGAFDGTGSTAMMTGRPSRQNRTKQGDSHWAGRVFRVQAFAFWEQVDTDFPQQRETCIIPFWCKHILWNELFREYKKVLATAYLRKKAGVFDKTRYTRWQAPSLKQRQKQWAMHVKAMMQPPWSFSSAASWSQRS